MGRLRMAVVGVGHLGKEHARILAGFPDVELVGVVDVNPAQAEAVAGNCRTTAFADYEPLLDRVDAVSVVVPTTLHHHVAGRFLRRGVAVLVEKPLALTADQGAELVDLARAAGTVLQVGHIERFNPAFEAVLGTTDAAVRPFTPRFVACERIGPFTGRSTDIGVVLDLMIHDIDLLLTLVGSPVLTVEALGLSIFGGDEDVANARVTFANGCVATLSASRASPLARRGMQVWAPEGFVAVDFAQRRVEMIQPSDELRRSGLDPTRMDPAARARLKDDLFSRYLHRQTVECSNPSDQLTRELRDFVGCVTAGGRPRVSGEDGQRALILAGRILESLRRHRWDGPTGISRGPHDLPAPRGVLFEAPGRQAA